MHETNRNYHNPNPLTLPRELIKDLPVEPKVPTDWRVWEINAPDRCAPHRPHCLLAYPESKALG